MNALQTLAGGITVPKRAAPSAGRRLARSVGRSLLGWLLRSVWPALPLLPAAGCVVSWLLGVL